ncbi:MAG: DUF3035 domain-containing protein [Geminicoccaceae bacterium]|nr:DUF3035 domain-containing protein [Geminicoccaceae bacterium]
MKVVPPLSILAVLALAGCGQSSIFAKEPPDEFMVVRERPLVLPPADTALPQPGQASTASSARDPSTGARDALLVPAPTTAASPGERALIGRLGAADPGIRAELAADANASAAKAPDTLFPSPFGQGAASGGGEPLVPAAEAARLRQGGIATTGPTTPTGQGS